MEKANIFQISWISYEEEDYYLFTHTNKTEEQFNQDVQLLLQKYGEGYMQKEKGWIGVNGWISFISDKMSELGYIPVKPITWSFFGGYILKGDSENDLEWRDIVGEELYNKALLVNKKIEKELRLP